MSDKRKQYKVYFVGEENSGKTKLIHQFVQENNEKYYYEKEFKKLKLKIFDTEGSQIYRSVTIERLKNADFIIFVFDPEQDKTFDELVEYWFKKASQLKESKTIFLIGKINHKKNDPNAPSIDKSYQDNWLKNSKKNIQINEIIWVYDDDIKDLEEKFEKKRWWQIFS